LLNIFTANSLTDNKGILANKVYSKLKKYRFRLLEDEVFEND